MQGKYLWRPENWLHIKWQEYLLCILGISLEEKLKRCIDAHSSNDAAPG